MTDNTPASAPEPPGDESQIDNSIPNSARIWNYFLGGKHNYPADREAGEQFLATFPDIAECARANRAFQARAVRYLASQEHVGQYLDIGTGMPAVDATHQVAQRITPQSRIVYVDNDPVVLLHARAMLTGAPEGTVNYIDADLRDPESIIREAAATLDLAQPVAVMLLGILGHIPGDTQAPSIVARLMDSVPSGSYLLVSDGTNVIRPSAVAAATDDYNDTGASPYQLRSPEQIARFFDGLHLIDPGVVSAPRWRPDPDPAGLPAEVDQFCGVARKP
mgnify:CR=1 FL=1